MSIFAQFQKEMTWLLFVEGNSSMSQLLDIKDYYSRTPPFYWEKISNKKRHYQIWNYVYSYINLKLPVGTIQKKIYNQIPAESRQINVNLFLYIPLLPIFLHCNPPMALTLIHNTYNPQSKFPN